MCDLESYVTDIQWFPGASKTSASGNDVFAATCSDGTLKIIGRAGHVEKTVDAHRGAAISLRWNSDGKDGRFDSIRSWSNSADASEARPLPPLKRGSVARTFCFLFF